MLNYIMEKQFLWLIDESCCFSDMDSTTLLDTLYRMNTVLGSIIYQNDTYSYEAYRSLLILNHNFRMFLNPDYLENKGDLSFLSYQIKSYYASGGNQDILPYLSNIVKYYDTLYQMEVSGKKQFVVSSFIRPFSGIPNDLKKFCEVPDFYPNISSDIIEKIHQKK